LTTLILLIFRILECILCIPTFLWLKLQKIERRRRRRRGVNNADRRQKRIQRTVVIIGGNFAGLAALWELKQWQFSNNNDDDDDDVRIVLIDQRDYSEYTPGVLRLYSDPWYFFRLAQKLPDTNKDDNFRRMKGTVTSIVDADNDKNNDGTNNAEHIKMKKKVLTYTDHDSSGTNDDTRLKMFAYDYLIIATGATYAAPISPATTTIGERGSTILDRNNEWHNAHTKLKGAKRVLILGGG
jgi:NADH dehydrogenase FAD-containing subunit